MRSRLMKTFEEITFSESKNSDLKRENANVNADAPMGTMLKYGTEAAKQFNEMFVLKPSMLERMLMEIFIFMIWIF